MIARLCTYFKGKPSICSFLPKKKIETLFDDFLPILDHSDHLVLKRKEKGLEISKFLLVYCCMFLQPPLGETQLLLQASPALLKIEI